ncbi:hypothetical protein EDB82DRAFT_561827 [Fusarium venenatum]|uniref:uncharacterized protein n=1 Tax=Fusarium venenatum TaxID=56646 RepID=UPI001DA2512F|nr:hypothetical protein EDB82DRAFT_561827 [Fusarium venenatum]
MFRLTLEPHFSLSQSTYQIPVLGADEENVSHLDTPVPEDAGLSAPLKPQRPGCQQNSNSLYMVRQTCQVLHNLTDDFQFECFESLCIPCGNLFDSGELEEKLEKLWQRVYYTGCQTDHPELLFPQGGRARNILVGLLGTFNLCKHVKVSGKVGLDDGKKVKIVCSHPDHFPDKMNSEELPSFKGVLPYIEYNCGCVRYSRSFPLLKIAPQQYAGMSTLKSRLLKQLKETHQYELCQHGPTQLNSIVSSLQSDKCNCFTAFGPSVRNSQPTGCNNHRGYDCLHCGARYFWAYTNDYIVLNVSIELFRRGAHRMGWLSNVTFYTDERPIHPILNESTKGTLWCTDPSCGTGCGNRWLLMMVLLTKFSLRRTDWCDRRVRDRSFAANLPYTLEYQVFQNATGWMMELDMLGRDLFFLNAKTVYPCTNYRQD